MVRTLFMAGWMMLVAGAHAADEVEPLDAEFLEYLANMEDEGDDWTLLAEPPRPAAAATESEPAASKPETRKPTKEAAKPAVEAR